MIKVFIEAEAGFFHKNMYNEKTLVLEGKRKVTQPYPFPYGFITQTITPDGDGIDCYVITNDNLSTDTIVECEPIGLLEIIEDGMVDHKVIAKIPGQEVIIGSELLNQLKTFIYAIFKEYPDATINVGNILPKQDTLDYIQKYVVE
jgi:inorganic pyrophosphatase